MSLLLTSYVFGIIVFDEKLSQMSKFYSFAFIFMKFNSLFGWHWPLLWLLVFLWDKCIFCCSFSWYPHGGFLINCLYSIFFMLGIGILGSPIQCIVNNSLNAVMQWQWSILWWLWELQIGIWLSSTCRNPRWFFILKLNIQCCCL